MEITYNKKISKFVVSCRFGENHLLNALPSKRFQKRLQLWYVPALSRNAQILLDDFRASMDAAAVEKAESILSTMKINRVPFPGWYRYDTKPFPHQHEALDYAWGLKSCALFMEMGTGKTKVAIDINCARVMSGEVEVMVVFCPNSVRKNWVNEVTVHSPLKDIPVHIIGDITKKKQKSIPEAVANSPASILVVGIESLSAAYRKGSAYTLLLDCIVGRKFSVVLDESHLAKNPDANRSRNIQFIAENATHRLIMTGTPIAQGVLDLYQQFQILDPNIIGIGDYYSYRNRYAIFGGYENREVVGYQNLDELMALLKPYVYQCTKDEVLDLPDKIYETRFVPMSKEQAQVYKGINKELEAMVADVSRSGKMTTVTVDHILAKYTLLQQVVGGFINYNDEEGEERVRRSAWLVKPENNPKVKELMRVIDENPNKSVLIWAKFINEIAIICDALRAKYGEDSVLEYKVGEDLSGFHEGRTRFFVSSQQRGGTGLTLNKASLVVYYSNGLRYIDRVQSEDRNHRIGQTNHVTYVDLLCDGSVDESIMQSIHAKKDVSDFVKEQMAGAVK